MTLALERCDAAQPSTNPASAEVVGKQILVSQLTHDTEPLALGATIGVAETRRGKAAAAYVHGEAGIFHYFSGRNMSKPRLAGPNKAERTRTAFGFVRVRSAEGDRAGRTSPNLPGQPPNITEQARTGTQGTAAQESPVTAAANAGAIGAGNGRQLA